MSVAAEPPAPVVEPVRRGAFPDVALGIVRVPEPPPAAEPNAAAPAPKAQPEPAKVEQPAPAPNAEALAAQRLAEQQAQERRRQAILAQQQEAARRQREWDQLVDAAAGDDWQAQQQLVRRVAENRLRQQAQAEVLPTVQSAIRSQMAAQTRTAAKALGLSDDATARLLRSGDIGELLHNAASVLRPQQRQETPKAAVPATSPERRSAPLTPAYGSRADLDRAVSAGTLSPAAARGIAVRRGWWKPPR